MKHFSEITAAVRHIPSSRCHSDAPTQSCCQRRIFALERSSRSSSRKTVLMTSPSECQKKADRRDGRSDHPRESSDYNCGHRMKRKDSSSQAPQNDNEKRNDGGLPSEITIVSRETSSDRPHIVPFICAPESPPEAAGFILRMFQLHPRRSSPVASMFRFVISESVQARGDVQDFRLHLRASLPSSEALHFQNLHPPAKQNPAPEKQKN